MLEKIKRDSLSYLRESRKYIYYSALAFFVIAVFAFFFSDRLTFLDSVLENLISKTRGLEGFDLALYILANNVQSAFFAIIFGSFISIVPVFNLVANGLVLGYVFSMVVESHGFIELWRILPHGIFELPAIFIAIGLGIKLGASFFTNRPLITFRERLYFSMCVFVTIILPLLMLAALIEGMLIDLIR